MPLGRKHLRRSRDAPMWELAFKELPLFSQVAGGSQIPVAGVIRGIVKPAIEDVNLAFLRLRQQIDP